jgi:hypothetical protein
MVYFQTQNPNLGKFWRALEWKRLVASLAIWKLPIMAIWYILWPLCNLVAIWYICPRFGTWCQEKSGNPVYELRRDSGYDI